MSVEIEQLPVQMRQEMEKDIKELKARVDALEQKLAGVFTEAENAADKLNASL